MQTRYLGRIPFQTALASESAADPETVLGFEPSTTVITLGLRGDSTKDILAAGTTEILRVTRGGQATLHNPGQLVIFPKCRVREGPRRFVERLVEGSRALAREFDQTLVWDAARPGLYTPAGKKVVAIGVCVRDGLSTHGLSINVRNELDDFRAIRACGVAAPALGHLAAGDLSLEKIFWRWASHFKSAVDKNASGA